MSRSTILNSHDTDEVSTFALAVVILMFAMFPVLMIYVACRRSRLKGKLYEFFLCHHKSAAAAFVRLLKMRLTSGRFMSSKVFIDSDYLRSLDNLFDFVAFDTKHFVVVHTADVLSRPWCAGEVTTAHAHKVSTHRIDFPGVDLETDTWIDNYSTHVPQIAGISQYGLQLPAIKDSLRWCIYAVPNFEFGGDVYEHIPAVCKWLCTGVEAARSNLREHRSESWSPAQFAEKGRAASSLEESSFICTLVSHQEIEAVCIAYIISRLVTPMLAQHPKLMPRILPENGEMGEKTRQVIVVCMEPAFRDRHVLCSLHAACGLGCGYVPVIVDRPGSAFQVPYASMIEKDRDMLQFLVGGGYRIDDIIVVVEQVFKEIAIKMDTGAGADTLSANANEIAERVLQKRFEEKRVDKQPSPGESSGLESKHIAPGAEPPPLAPDMAPTPSVTRGSMSMDIAAAFQNDTSAAIHQPTETELDEDRSRSESRSVGVSCCIEPVPDIVWM